MVTVVYYSGNSGYGDTDYLALQDPNLPPQVLQDIANRRGDLAAQVLAHPNTYPELSAWIIQAHPELAPQLLASAQPALPQATPALPPEPSAPKSRGLLIATITTGLLLAAAIGFGLWWFLGSSSSSSSSGFDAKPRRAAVVDLRTFGDNLELKPIGVERKPMLRTDGVQLVAFAAGDDYFLAGIDPNFGTGLPVWVIPTDDPSDAQVVDGWYFAGDTVYKVDQRAAVPGDVAGNPPPKPAPTQPKAEQAPGSSGTNSKSSHGDKPTKLGPTATADVPVTFDADTGELFGADGVLITELGGQTQGDLEEGEDTGEDAGDDPTNPDATPQDVHGVNPDSSDIWVICDGFVVLGVRDSEVVWEVQLPSGSDKVNGFGTETGPTLSASNNSVLVGTPTGIVDLDVETGDQLWKIDTPVTSWQAGDGVITVLDGTELSIFDQEAPGEETPDEEALDARPQAPTPLTAEEILNVTVELPQPCADSAGLGGATTFQDGYAEGTGGSVNITGSAEMLIDGQIATAIVFTCESSSPSTLMASVGVYSPDLHLIGSPEITSQDRVASYAQEVKVRGQGSELHVLAQDFYEERTYLWDGEDFVLIHVGPPGDDWGTQGNGLDFDPHAGGLQPEDLANITLTVPKYIGAPKENWIAVEFTNYENVSVASDGFSEYREIERSSITPTMVGGRPYLFFVYGSSMIGDTGTVCAVSPSLDVACAPWPEIPSNITVFTEHFWPENIVVNGDTISYDMDTGYYVAGRFTQRFDGENFTLVESDWYR